MDVLSEFRSFSSLRGVREPAPPDATATTTVVAIELVAPLMVNSRDGAGGDRRGGGRPNLR